MAAQVTKSVRAELNRLYEKNGCLREEDIVQASKTKSSPLHPLFMWDDEAAAAHLGRLEIARTLVRKVTILKAEAKEYRCSVTIRKYHGLGDGGGYRDIRDVLTQRDLRDMLLRQALGEIDVAQKRYEKLAELKPVWEAAKRVKRKASAKKKPARKRGRRD